ncbi:MAG: hypothetical protein CUN57_00450 [Phototrophicales bacterium]|nr:MAG: hypothetical protein CUN57_00450 [Phototrophicales bacterium]
MCGGNVRVCNIGNPIDVERFFPLSREKSRKDVGLMLGKKVAMFCAVGGGRDENKGGQLFLDAAKRLRETGEWEFCLVGCGNKERLPGVVFSHVSDEDLLRRLMCASDVVVVPSRVENLSYMIMEAMACAVPVVAFDVGGNSDLVEDGVTGWLIRDRCAEALYRCLEGVSCGEAMRRGKAARDRVVARFSYDRIAEEYCRLFRACVAGEELCV